VWEVIVPLFGLDADIACSAEYVIRRMNGDTTTNPAEAAAHVRLRLGW
jgi:hypothetical protein